MDNPSKYILSPVSFPQLKKLRLSDRPARIAGLRVAMIDNTKENGSVVLDRFEELLVGTYGAASVLRHRKPGRTLPVAAHVIDAVKANCDIVISALGD
jgi:hypothetical protein